MRWEHLSGPDFEAGVKKADGVCIIPVGVIEYHGPHLPLGTDTLYCHALACAAAEREPAIVFPAYHFGVNVETKHFPGGIVIRDELLMPLLENICDEISRNGLKKILLLSGHGGNRYWLPLFVQLMLDKRKDYLPYYVRQLADSAVSREVLETTVDGHAGEFETSVSLHCFPGLVNLKAVEPGTWWSPQGRLAHLPALYTPSDWASNFPEHCAGDPHPATAEKGRTLFEADVAALVAHLTAVKADDIALAVYREFGDRTYER
jgi:creatinine amidohydrolase